MTFTTQTPAAGITSWHLNSLSAILQTPQGNDSFNHSIIYNKKTLTEKGTCL